MPIQNINHVKKIAFSPSAPDDAKRRHSTTPLRTPFRHLIQFPLNSPLHLLRIMTESVTSNGQDGPAITSASIRFRPSPTRMREEHRRRVLGGRLAPRSIRAG